MDRSDVIADIPPSQEEAKRRIEAGGLTGPRTCGKCGQLRKGRVIYGFTDYFVCFNCLVRDEAKIISQTDEFLRKDRVWRIRKARENWNKKQTETAEEVIRNTRERYNEICNLVPDITQKEKEMIARELLKTIDQRYLSDDVPYQQIKEPETAE